MAVGSLSDSPAFALWTSSAIVYGLVSAWPSHSGDPWLTGSSAPVGITGPPLRFYLVFHPTPGLIWLFSPHHHRPSSRPTSSTAQVCLKHDPSQGHVETSRSCPCHTQTSSYSGKPNSFCKPFAPRNSTLMWHPRPPAAPPKAGAVQPLCWGPFRVPNPKPN